MQGLTSTTPSTGLDEGERIPPRTPPRGRRTARTTSGSGSSKGSRWRKIGASVDAASTVPRAALLVVHWFAGQVYATARHVAAARTRHQEEKKSLGRQTTCEGFEQTLAQKLKTFTTSRRKHDESDSTIESKGRQISYGNK
jgi:hypothetical protein